MIMLGIALQAFAAASLGIAGAVVLDYLGVAGAAREGSRSRVAMGRRVSAG
jgi:hypothetical protein